MDPALPEESRCPARNKNYPVYGMLLFTAVFYLVLYFSQTASEKKELSSPETKKSSVLSRQELKEREELFKKNLQANPHLLTAISSGFLLVLAAGLLFNIYLLGRKSRGIPFIAPQPVWQKTVPWGLREVFQVFVLLFFTEAFLLFLEMLASFFLDLRWVGKEFILMTNSLLRDLSVAAFVIWMVRQRFKEPLSEIGLTTRNAWGNIKTGLAGYLAVLPALFLTLFLVAMLAQLASYEPPPQPVVEIYLKESSQKVLLFFTFFVAIVGPAIEEIFFRGFTYRAFRARFGVRGAMIATAALFATLHMNLVAFFPIFLLGIFLAYLYEKKGSLVPCMAVHMLHNFIMVGFTLFFKSLSG